MTQPSLRNPKEGSTEGLLGKIFLLGNAIFFIRCRLGLKLWIKLVLSRVICGLTDEYSFALQTWSICLSSTNTFFKSPFCKKTVFSGVWQTMNILKNPQTCPQGFLEVRLGQRRAAKRLPCRIRRTHFTSRELNEEKVQFANCLK